MGEFGRFTEAEYARRLADAKARMAGVWLDDFGVAISESFVVMEHGGCASAMCRANSSSSIEGLDRCELSPSP